MYLDTVEKVLISLVLTVIVLCGFGVYLSYARNEEFRIKCENKGGYAYMAYRTNRICLPKDSVIQVK